MHTYQEACFHCFEPIAVQEERRSNGQQIKRPNKRAAFAAIQVSDHPKIWIGSDLEQPCSVLNRFRNEQQQAQCQASSCSHSQKQGP